MKDYFPESTHTASLRELLDSRWLYIAAEAERFQELDLPEHKLNEVLAWLHSLQEALEEQPVNKESTLTAVAHVRELGRELLVNPRQLKNLELSMDDIAAKANAQVVVDTM